MRAGYVRASPFLARDDVRVRELVSGLAFTPSSDELAMLESARDGLAISTLTSSERALASGLLSQRLLLDDAAYAEIARRTVGSMDLEIAGACNAECIFCPRDALRAGRGVGIMRRQTFDAVVDKLAPYLRFVGFVGIGEPTLHKELPSFVAELSGRGIKTMVVTNGSMLTDELIAALLDAKLGSIQVSLNGLDRASYEDHMVGLELAQVLPRVERLLALARDRIPIAISAVETERNGGQLVGFVEYWRERGVSAEIVPCHSRGGTIVALGARRRVESAPRCALFASRIFVSWDGRALACCHDVDGQTELGKIAIDTADSIIARKLEVMAGTEWFPICQTCDEPARLQQLTFTPRTL